MSHVVETLRGFGPVQAKAMFGGWGLYHEGVFFALVAGDVLYLKTDAENRADFEARGLGPFVYPLKDGKGITMTYFEAPGDALEDPAVMARWARGAYAAALRASARKAKAAKAPK